MSLAWNYPNKLTWSVKIVWNLKIVTSEQESKIDAIP